MSSPSCELRGSLLRSLSKEGVAAGAIIGAILALAFVGLLFLYALGGTLIGLFVGVILSVTGLGGFVETGLTALGFHAQGQIVPISAALGFVAGIFHGVIEVKHKEK